MALLESLRAKTMAARKAAMRKDWAMPGTLAYLSMTEDEIAAQASQQALVPHATFLVTVLADATNLAIAARRPVSDQDADKAIRDMVKNLNEVTEKFKATAYGAQAAEKVALLQEFLPDPLDEHTLTMAITDAAAFLDTTPALKEMGRIMKRLNELYPGQIEGAVVRKIIESGNC